WNAAHRLGACLDSLAAQTAAPRLEVLVVDNASVDGTAGLLAARDDVRVLRTPRNLGFAGGLAAAVEATTTPYLVLLNDDARYAPDAVEQLLAAVEAPDATRVGGVTAKVLLSRADEAGRRLVNSTGNVVDRWGAGQDRDWLAVDGTERGGADVFGVNGGACLLRRAAVLDAGGVDADLFLYYEDTDLSWRMRARGWTVRYAPTAVAEHDHASS
ncbi:glycosyltransferase family 2 protein, partial [Cellulomonas sp.]|uniref:glycosyltransferase family 2 protein n=1 Tax=Cellulomonas sp. TaxID=40001 RepID=UPI001B1180E8